MSRLTWADEWNEEHDAMMEEVIRRATSSPARVALYEQLRDDAVQAQRPWAIELQREDAHKGAVAHVSAYLQKQGGKIPGRRNGRSVTTPAVVGITRTDDDGEAWVQQEFLHKCEWRELEAKRATNGKMEEAYAVKNAVIDKFLELRTKVPGARTPEDACEKLGVTVLQYLSSDGIAA